MKYAIDFIKGNGLIPAIIQDATSGEVYMLGYMNELAFRKTFKTGWIHFWSRKRQLLWMKGEESGNRLKLKEMYVDCDYDTLLVKVELIGNNVCHTGKKSCFYTKVEGDK